MNDNRKDSNGRFNPAQPKLPRSVPQNNIELFFTAIDGHLRDRAIITLMLDAGIRIGDTAISTYTTNNISAQRAFGISSYVVRRAVSLWDRVAQRPFWLRAYGGEAYPPRSVL